MHAKTSTKTHCFQPLSCSTQSMLKSFWFPEFPSKLMFINSGLLLILPNSIVLKLQHGA